MENRLTGWFLTRYSSAEALERKQIVALVYMLEALALGSLAVFAIMGNPAMRLALAALVLMALGLLLLVRAGRAAFTSVATTTLLSALFAGIPFMQHYRNEYELYLVATLECFALILTSLVARKRWQSLVVLASSLASMVAVFFLRVVPNAGEAGPRYTDITITLFVVVLATVIERSIKSRDDTLLGIARAEAEKNRAQVEKLEGVIRSSITALDLGVAARDSAEATERLVDEMKASLEAAGIEFKDLERSAVVISESYLRIDESSRLVDSKVSDQSAVISQSSAAIEEMTASVNNIAGIASARLQAIATLKATTDEGTAQMANSAEALRAVEAAATSIVEVVNVIRNVASQTNLLAMNAAIEAAHAGDAGRGFSVVADEIRKLSEETSANVKIINRDIKRTLEAMKTAGVVNESAQAIFRKVDVEADAVAKAMDEIGRGLQEISAGSGEILQGTTESVSFTTTVKEASRSMGQAIAESRTDLDRLKLTTESVSEKLVSVLRKFDRIRAESAALSEAGRKNEQALKGLMDNLTA